MQPSALTILLSVVTSLNAQIATQANDGNALVVKRADESSAADASATSSDATDATDATDTSSSDTANSTSSDSAGSSSSSASSTSNSSNSTSSSSGAGVQKSASYGIAIAGLVAGSLLI